MRSQFVVLIASPGLGPWPDSSRSGRAVEDCEKVLSVIDACTVDVISMFGIGLSITEFSAIVVSRWAPAGATSPVPPRAWTVIAIARQSLMMLPRIDTPLELPASSHQIFRCDLNPVHPVPGQGVSQNLAVASLDQET